MMLMSTTHHKIKTQTGVSIVTAIFLVVVLALMGAGMVSILTTSKQSISQEYTSAKAYMAAHTCLQWGMYQTVFATPNGSYTTNFTDPNSSLFKTSCSTTINNTTADGLTFFNINTTANFGGTTDPEFSQRQMRLQFQPNP